VSSITAAYAAGCSRLRGQSRHFGRRQTTSGLPSETDIVRAAWHVSKVPTTDISALDRVNSLYEEPFVSSRQGGDSLPRAATGTPSPTRAISEQHLHAVLSLVRRIGQGLSVPLASRPSGNRFGQFPTKWPEAFPDGLLSRAEQFVTLTSPEAMHMRQALQIFRLLPFLHSPRRFGPRAYPTGLSAATVPIMNDRYCPLGQLDQI